MQPFACLLAVAAWPKTGASSAGEGRRVGFKWCSGLMAQGIHGAKKGALCRTGAAVSPLSPLILQPQHRPPHTDVRRCHLISISSLCKAIFPDYW